MSIRPSVAHSCKHLSRLQRSPAIHNIYLNINLTPWRDLISLSLKRSVTDFGYCLVLFSDRISFIVTRCSSYRLQSHKICSSVCCPSPHSHSAVNTMLNLFRLTLRLVWPAFIRFINTKERRFILMARNQGDDPFL
jgi:hypothetical protein